MSLPVLVPLLLAVTGAQPYDTSVPNDPRVEVWLDSNAELDRGDRARVYARSAQDGFLLVLHADAEGRVRVLYPIDPYMDDFVRGGETIEIRGRSDREAIFVDERAGSGVVLAAWSPDPFRFDAYVRGDHWDYRLITPVGANEDGEAALLDVVHRMADGRSFDYDVEPYVVGARSARTPIHVAVGLGSPWCWGCGGWPYHHRSGFHLSVRIGDPYWGPHFSYWRPYWLRPVYYDPYWYRSRWAWGHGWWGYDRWDWRDRRRGGVHIRYAWSSPCWNDPYCGRDPWRRARPGRASGTWLAGDSEWLGRGAPPLLDPSRSDTRSRFGGTRVTSPERSPNVDRVIAEPERPGIRDGTRTIARPERPASGGPLHELANAFRFR